MINLNNGDTRPKDNYFCVICKCRIFSNINWEIEFMPKRLLYLPYMKVIMVQDLCYKCYDEAENFTIISHVWGETNLYAIEDLSLSGIDWKVPLNKKEKILKIKNMDKNIKYIWFDILCMKQDDKNDIDNHIPFMGNYYSKANECIALMSTEYINNPIDWLINDNWSSRVWTLPEMILPSKVILMSDMYRLELDELISDIRKGKYLINKNVLSSGMRAINHLLENGKRFDIASCHKLMVGRECMYEEDRIHAMMSMLNSKLGTMYGEDIDISFGKLIFEQIKFKDYSFIGWKYGNGNNTIGANIFPKINKIYDWYKINALDYSDVLIINEKSNQISLLCKTEAIVYNIETIDITNANDIIFKNLCDICYLIDLPTKEAQLNVAIDLLSRCTDEPFINEDNGEHDDHIYYYDDVGIDFKLQIIKEKIHFIKNFSTKTNKLYLIIGRKENGWAMYLSEYKPQLNISIVQTKIKIGNRTYLWFFSKERGKYLYRELAFSHKPASYENYDWKMIV